MFFIHGEQDSVVLVSESEYTHRQLQRAGVRSVLHIVPDAEHGLHIQTEEGKLAPQVEDLYKQAFEFLAKEMAWIPRDGQLDASEIELQIWMEYSASVAVGYTTWLTIESWFTLPKTVKSRLTGLDQCYRMNSFRDLNASIT